MAGVNLRYEVLQGEILRGLREIEALAHDARPAFKAVGEYLQVSHRERFDRMESPSGQPWAPLDPATRRRKPRRKDQLLVLDTYLRDTQRYRAGRRSLEYGTNLIYGATHQFGDEERGIPQREWLGLSAADESRVPEILLDYIGGRLGR